MLFSGFFIFFLHLSKQRISLQLLPPINYAPSTTKAIERRLSHLSIAAIQQIFSRPRHENAYDDDHNQRNVFAVTIFAFRNTRNRDAKWYATPKRRSCSLKILSIFARAVSTHEAYMNCFSITNRVGIQSTAAMRKLQSITFYRLNKSTDESTAIPWGGYSNQFMLSKHALVPRGNGQIIAGLFWNLIAILCS